MREFFKAHCGRLRGAISIWSRSVLIIGAVAVSPVLAGQLSPDVSDLPSGSVVDVIVQFRQPPAASDLAAMTSHGGRLKKTFKHIPGIVITVPAAALKGIAANPNV